MSEYIADALENGRKFPYDEAPASADWARLAALGIMANLYNRVMLQGVLAVVDLERRREMVDSCAAIIRAAASAVDQNALPEQRA